MPLLLVQNPVLTRGLTKLSFNLNRVHPTVKACPSFCSIVPIKIIVHGDPGRDRLKNVHLKNNYNLFRPLYYDLYSTFFNSCNSTVFSGLLENPESCIIFKLLSIRKTKKGPSNYCTVRHKSCLAHASYNLGFLHNVSCPDRS